MRLSRLLRVAFLASRPFLFLVALGACLAASGPASAHRLSPGFLGITEIAPGVYDAQWKVSISGGLSALLSPAFPDRCKLEGAVRTHVIDDARIQLGRFRCERGLAGARLAVDGLESTQTDVLVRVEYLDGSSFTHRLVPEATLVEVPKRNTSWDVASTYLILGVEHILLGIDHLLFVLALVLLIDGTRKLVVAITAFTMAHSLTLGAATLGFVQVPTLPVEATIALSILFLATELARGKDSLTLRSPWLVAFAFGLLHGFGFAGALSEVGLPERAIPLALLFFNMGVELGQLAFIAAVLTIGLIVRRAGWRLPRTWPRLAAYGIGSIAAFWTIERSAQLLSG